MMHSTDRKPRVAYVMTPITFGGAEKVNLNFLNNVNRDNFIIDPILFLRPWENATVFESELEGQCISFTPIPVARSEKFDAFRIVRSLRILKQLLELHSYDLIHTHGYLADILGFMVSKYLKIPIISTCHGFIYEGAKLSLYNYVDCLLLRRFTKIITVSKNIRDELIGKGVESNLITVIGNCPQTHHHDSDRNASRNAIRNDNHIDSQELVVGYVGRLSSEKGISYLMKALALMKCNSFPVKLLIIGEGPQREALEDMAVSLHVADQVVFIGFKSNIDDWLTAIDILVLPSLTEGSPMILLEAMSHGVPCIASAVGDIPQVIDSGIDGLLVAPGNPKELSDAISSLCTDKEKREDLSINAKQKISLKYNITNWTAKIENVYLNILQMPISI